MAFSTPQPSKLLQVAPEIRKIIYGHLFLEPSRELHLYDCHDEVKVIPGLPTQVLRVCRQLKDEASGMIEESLARIQLQVESCDETLPPQSMATPKQDAFMSTYGPTIGKIELDECQEDYIDIRQILCQCTALKKLVVTCYVWNLELEGVAEKGDKWWLGDPWIPEWTWRIWEDFGSRSWQETSIWPDIMKSKRGAGRDYDIEIIARYDILGANKNLCMAFDLDTKTALRRWLEHLGEVGGPESPR